MSKSTIESDQLKLIGPGVRLRMVREELGLKRSDVAAGLRLREEIIVDIERDNYNKSPEVVFLRGYLRSYARLLNIDADEIISSFNNLNLPEKKNERLISVPIIRKKRSKVADRLTRWMIYLFILGLVSWSGHWWYTQKADKDSSLSNKLRLYEGVE